MIIYVLCTNNKFCGSDTHKRSSDSADLSQRLNNTTNIMSYSRDNVVCVMTRYGLEGPGIEFRWRRGFTAPILTGAETHQRTCTMGTGSLLRG